MPSTPAQRLLIIGWDAADWILIDRLFAAGKMPVLKGLVEAGTRADLGTLEPKLSPLLWTSIATGKTADKHGILNFVEPKPDGDGLRISASTSRKTKALWNILSQSGVATNVIGWYASHPAEPIRGSITSNLLQEGDSANAEAAWPLVSGAVHPSERAELVAASRQSGHSLPRQTLLALLPMCDEIGLTDERVRTLAKLMAYAVSIERAALIALKNGAPWDAASATTPAASATMVFFDAIDTTGHHFMQFVAPKMAHVLPRDQKRFGEVMNHVYQWHDAALGRLLEASGAETTVILLSDHGFHSDHLRPNLTDLPPERRMELESSWHRPQGVLVMSGPGVQRGVEIASPNILDIAPTALALLGLPAGDDFDGRVLSEAIIGVVPARIPSWDSVEGDAGLHPADVRQDPFEAADAIQQLVDLGYMAAMPSDVQGQVDLVRRESNFNLAVALMSRQRAHEAIPMFERLVAQRPAESRYALGLGNCLLSSGRFIDAAACAKAFLVHDPSSVEAQMLSAAASALCGDREGARATVAAIERATRNRPEMSIAFANILATCGRYSEAVPHYEAAKGRNSRDPAVHIGLANAKLALGSFEASIEHSLDALEISQALPEAHLTLGAALAWMGDHEHAATSFAYALQFAPGQIDACRFLALVNELLAAGDARTRAESLLATAPARPPDSPHGPADFARKHGLRDI